MSDEQGAAPVIPARAVREFDRWSVPAVDANEKAGATPAGPSLAELEQIQKDAYDEAFAQGLEEGRAAGAAEMAERADLFDTLATQLARPFEALDEAVEREAAQLAMAVARKLVRRELRTDPSCVIGVVREALTVLPVAARDVRVLLHPQDAELVRTTLRKTEGERAWHIVEDPMLTRGGCRVESASSRIDARVEARLASIASALIDDERGA